MVPPLTSALIAASVALSLAAGFGASTAAVRPFLISEYAGGPPLIELRSGQLWRLFTPMFLHFGLLHLAFNMMWLWELGGALERRFGTLPLVALVAALAAASNVAEYAWSGPYFGGMSGVVYGLLGYFWMQGRYNGRFRMALPRHVIVMMLAWFALCWSGLIGNIANMAHTVGLLLGALWGFTAARMGRP
jgi:GlpG protein